MNVKTKSLIGPDGEPMTPTEAAMLRGEYIQPSESERIHPIEAAMLRGEYVPGPDSERVTPYERERYGY